MSMILTLTGMSTSGKSTLAKALTATGVFAEAVSVTTRAMRPGEVDGRDYTFISQEVFDQYVEQGKLLEHVRSHHACYGVPASEVTRIQAEGKSVVMVLEPEGVSSIQKIALANNSNFQCTFVHVDMRVLLERFFERIQIAKDAGKVINFDQESKRLHVMLSQERGWIGRFDWDMTLMNLHVGDNLTHEVNNFLQLHKNADFLKAVPRELKPGLPIECRTEKELAAMIERQTLAPISYAAFHKEAIAPLIEMQRKVRNHEEAPSLA